MISHHIKMPLFYEKTCICFTNKFTSIQKFKFTLIPNSLSLPVAFRLLTLSFSCVDIVLDFQLYSLALFKGSIYFANYLIPCIIYPYDSFRTIRQGVKKLIRIITVNNVSVVSGYDDVNGSYLLGLSGVVLHERAYLLARIGNGMTIVGEVAILTAVTA